ncbi:hypothetical protein DPMN_000216 [Dreissena polymorpha]|uniref:Uncharacterized protein n=1 Tax=Dreissena polymorpha TaxID=45954 RepID=A0A9D4RPB3_DREPO|nr:hypothetical protein DPMN_000216 [Dreissena polymorpha]
MDSCAGLHGETDRKVWDPEGKEKMGFIDPSAENNFRLGFLCPKELDFGGIQSKVWDPGGNEEAKLGFINPSIEEEKLGFIDPSIEEKLGFIDPSIEEKLGFIDPSRAIKK